MSANNYILIVETNIGYRIQHRDVDTQAVYDTHHEKTLREAIERAIAIRKEAESDGFSIEYGIEISLQSLDNSTKRV